jgi:hypothetical protein
LNIAFHLKSSFILTEGIPIQAEDLSYGLQGDFINSTTAIEIAVSEMKRGTQDPVMIDLACLVSDEASKARGILNEMLADPERFHDPRETVRKWIYFILKAAYVEQSRFTDPFGVVEDIYAYFDYPKSMDSFIRYMPLMPGDEPGLDAMRRRWANFLEQEHKALARSLNVRHDNMIMLDLAWQ